MAANIETKAIAADIRGLHARARQISGAPARVLEQQDTFFHTPHGRLKLREASGQGAELIFYSRPDQAGPKQSDYVVCGVPDPAALKQALSAALGVRGVVRKTRTLYLAGQTRIHLDEVESLGSFVELEYVLREGEDTAAAEQEVGRLLDALGVLPEHLVSGAYIDLL